VSTDVQIVAGGVDAAPLQYKIPAAQELILKTLFASFDGTAAAGPFLAAARILSPAGKVVAEFFNPTAVAAGSSADVSWAPFLGASLATPAVTPTGNVAFAFGDGSDGALHYDGVTTVLGMVPVAGVYTLTRDIFATNMVVDAGVRIINAGWRIFGTGTLTNAGRIDGDGNPAAFNNPGALLAANGFYGNRGVGGGAGSSGVGTVGSTTSTGITLGGAGGHGGTGTAGVGGAGGAAPSTFPQITASLLHHYIAWVMGSAPGNAGAALAALAWYGGAGGGGGGGSAGDGHSGGGGGGGGGVILVAFRLIVNTGTISANGGLGGSTNPNFTNAGVGGGGGGGGVGVFTNGLTGNTPTASGGAIGAVGTVTAATAGANGTVTVITLSG